MKNEIFADSYYAQINYPIKSRPISEKNYFILLNNKKVGILDVGYSVEFAGRYGIGLIGILKKSRKQGLTKYTINFCKKKAKKLNENKLLLSIPKEADELQTIFRKLGFKGSRTKTHVYFDDCMFSMLTDNHLKYLDLSKSTKTFKWQELVMDL